MSDARRSDFRQHLREVLSLASHVDTLDDAAVDRYLVARNQDVAAAVAMARESEEWHMKVNPASITPSMIPKALPSGCWRFAGKATDGRPILLIQAGLWRPSDYSVEEYVDYVAFMMFNNLERAPPSVSKQIVLFDMSGWSMFQNNISMLKQLIHINQVCFPERLSLAVLSGTPAPFKWVWNVISPFIDPKTRAKVFLFTGNSQDTARCQALLRENIPAQVLQAEYGGSRKHPYPIPPAEDEKEGKWVQTGSAHVGTSVAPEVAVAASLLQNRSKSTVSSNSITVGAVKTRPRRAAMGEVIFQVVLSLFLAAIYVRCSGDPHSNWVR